MAKLIYQYDPEELAQPDSREDDQPLTKKPSPASPEYSLKEESPEALLATLKSGKEILFEAAMYEDDEDALLARLRYDPTTATVIHSQADGSYPFHIALSLEQRDDCFQALGFPPDRNHTSMLLRDTFDQYWEQIIEPVPSVNG